MHLVCYCLLFFAHFCHSEDCPESQKCNQVLEMEEVGDDLFEMTSKIFFIESSGRDHLLNKQICSIESAVRNSNIDKVVVTMTSKNLNLAANNATCQMFFSYQGKLLFRHVDKDKLFKGTF